MIEIGEPIHCCFWILEDFEDEDYIRGLVQAIYNAPEVFKPKRYSKTGEKSRRISSSEDLDYLILILTAKDIPTNKPKYVSVEISNNKIEFQIHWNKYTRENHFQLISVDLKIKYEVDFELAPDERFSSMLIDSKNQTIVEEFLAFMKNLIPAIRPIYGEFTDIAPIYDTSHRAFDLKLRLPDTQQISIYGPPWINLFSRQLIESSPFEKIEKLSNDYYWLEATQSVFQTVSTEKKAEIRQHFGEESFMDGGKKRHPSGKVRYISGVAPDYDFSKTTTAVVEP